MRQGLAQTVAEAVAHFEVRSLPQREVETLVLHAHHGPAGRLQQVRHPGLYLCSNAYFNKWNAASLLYSDES